MPESEFMQDGTFISPAALCEQRQAAENVRNFFRTEGRIDSRAPGVYIQTFGCQQNEADSERLCGLAVSMGYRAVSTPEEAELILVNTCAIREHAEKRALSIIGQYKHLKDRNPSVLIGVGGCMVTQEHRANKLKTSYPYVAFTFDTGAIHRLPELVQEALKGGKRHFLRSDSYAIAEGLPLHRESRHMAWLSVMYGCNNFCSYCIVPYVRGRERSRRMEDILAEAQMLIADGARDITLLGQNVNSYGKDLDEGYDFSDVLHNICALPGDFRVRFMTSHPKDASDKLIETIAAEKKIVRHLHLPVQSGSNEVLRRMNRRYTREHYISLIEKMRAAVPDVSLTSDIIVGFPGETEEDFQATLSLLQTVQYDMIFSFIYSPRQGTPAADMPDQIPHDVSTERFERLLAVQNAISTTRNERFIGRTLRVLVESESKNNTDMLTGRGDPVRPIHFNGDRSLIGSFTDVRITGVTPFTLEGERIENVQ